jgi:hypothetical protein
LDAAAELGRVQAVHVLHGYGDQPH